MPPSSEIRVTVDTSPLVRLLAQEARERRRLRIAMFSTLGALVVLDIALVIWAARRG